MLPGEARKRGYVVSRTPLPLHVADLSAFARALRRQLDGQERLPSHLELLNLLAKAAGFKNFQHFRAQAGQPAATPEAIPETAAQAAPAPEAAPRADPAPEPAAVDPRLVNRLLRLYDREGRLLRWPKKLVERQTSLWVLWTRLPAHETMTEREISDRITDHHAFGDYAFLRRQLVDNAMVTRTPDGREYRRVEGKPSIEALALLERLNA